MKKISGKITLTFLFSFAVLLSASWLVSCDKDSDASEITEEMADRLTAAMKFENGKLKELPIPEDHQGSPDHPQITSYKLPDELTAGDSFTLKLGTDFDNPDDVAGAVVYVQKATHYLEIDTGLEELAFDIDSDTFKEGERLMILEAQLDRNFDISQDDFEAVVAMIRSDGEAGNYITWRLDVEGTDSSETDGDANTNNNNFAPFATDMLICTDDQFMCPDDVSQPFSDNVNIWVDCWNGCETPTSATTPEELSCWGCCSKTFKAKVSKETWTECYGCVLYISQGQSGGDSTPDEKRSEADTIYDSVFGTPSEWCLE